MFILNVGLFFLSIPIPGFIPSDRFAWNGPLRLSFNRRKLLKRLLAVCKAQPEIKAVIIVGSQAREISKADEYSDLDLIIACSEPQILLYENNI